MATQGNVPAGDAVLAALPPTLERTDLNLRESVPVVMGFLIVVPFLALPWLIRLWASLVHTCSTTLGCTVRIDVGLGLLQTLVGAANVPDAIRRMPILADIGLSALAVTAAVLLCVLLRIPPIGGSAPVLKASARMLPRTGQAFDFIIRDAHRPHRIAVHAAGRHTGYPGDLLIALKLTLHEARPLEVERSVAPVAEPAPMNAVTDYVYDPFYYQFTPTEAGPAHLWVGYGNGPEAMMRVSITRRD